MAAASFATAGRRAAEWMRSGKGWILSAGPKGFEVCKSAVVSNATVFGNSENPKTATV